MRSTDMAHIIRNAAPPTELLRRLGRTLEDFQKDSRYLGEHRQALTQQYPDEWVVILDCKVVGHHPDADELRKASREWTSAQPLGISSPRSLRTGGCRAG
jgi:hypothetical protein